MTQANPRCPLCYGRGGAYAPTLDGGRRWVKCTQCFPRQTRQQAREKALERFLTGNHNALARAACLRLGWSERELDERLQAYIDDYHPTEGLF